MYYSIIKLRSLKIIPFSVKKDKNKNKNWFLKEFSKKE